MGVEVGFLFYRYGNGKLEKANIIEDFGSMCNYLFVCGRCDATDLFCDLVYQFDRSNAYREQAKPEDKYTPYLLMNHPELDGFEDHSQEKEYDGWFGKYFFYGLEKFKTSFDFESAEEKHNALLKELNDELVDMRQEIESLRTHQERAKTKAAFDGFEEKIKESKEDIFCKKEEIKDTEEDDYDYNHYKRIKEDIERVEKIIADDPSIVVAAFASY